MRKIDLKVPTGWNQCTKEQLEAVAGIILRRTAMQDRYHPYDPVHMKAEAFLALAGLEVVGHTDSTDGTDFNGHTEITESTESSSGEEGFMVRFVDKRSPWLRPLPRLAGTLKGRKKEPPFELKVWQVHSFVNQHLGWLDDFNGLLLFPFPTYGWPIITVKWLFDYFPMPWIHRVAGPAELMQDFSWQEYRMVQLWLDLYVQTNTYVASLNGRPADPETIALLKKCRERFLTALFRSQSYLSVLSESLFDKPWALRRFRRMPDHRFQLCLIYWQSMMHYYAEKLPKCFRQGSGHRRRGETPLDIYRRSTTTLQKYLQKTEAEINAQPFYVILQHLDDMAREAEELEKIQRQHKK